MPVAMREMQVPWLGGSGSGQPSIPVGIGLWLRPAVVPVIVLRIVAATVVAIVLRLLT